MESFTGEIQLFAFNFAPAQWAFCQGQLVAIQQNTALFSLIGTQFGGNGQSTFQLPNLGGQVVAGAGQGPGLSPWVQGEQEGSQQVSLLLQEIPQHTHGLRAYDQRDATKRHATPANGDALALPGNAALATKDVTPNTQFPLQMLDVTGQSLPHENMQPYLALNFCICLQGNFPAFQ